VFYARKRKVCERQTHNITTTSVYESNKLNDEQRLTQVTSIWQIIVLRM